MYQGPGMDKNSKDLDKVGASAIQTGREPGENRGLGRIGP